MASPRNIVLILFCTLGIVYLKDEILSLVSPNQIPQTKTLSSTVPPANQNQTIELPTQPDEQVTLTVKIMSSYVAPKITYLLLEHPNGSHIFATSKSNNLTQLIQDSQIHPGTSAQVTLKQDTEPLENTPRIVHMYSAKGPFRITAIKIPSPTNSVQP